MTIKQPPGLGTWLALRLVSGPRRESLVGDLIEQYRQGRSVVWYWRQVLMAILASAASDVGAHKLLALRALTIGWALYVLFSGPVNWLLRIVRVSIDGWLASSGHYSSWNVFWAHHLSADVLISIACAVSGWMVARLHPMQAAAMVGLYGVSVFLFEYGMISYMLARYGVPSIGHPLMMILPAVLAICRPLAILLGGLWALRSAGDASRPVSMA